MSTAKVPAPTVASSNISDMRRSALLGTVAAGMLLFGYGRSANAAPDACVVVGAVVTCTGDQSEGIASGTDFILPGIPPITTLNVNNLNQNIAPVTNDHGIYFDSAGPITIRSDTTDGPGGPFEIVTINSYSGIFARSSASTVSVTSTGDIMQSGFGGFAIRVAADGDAYLRQTGDLTSGNVGTFVTSTNGEVEVISDGIINAQITGIDARGQLATQVTSTGDITADIGTAIDARSTTNAVTVKSYGDLDAGAGGIVIVAAGNGDAYVKSEGRIAAGIFEGIFAGAADGNTYVKSTGDVSSDGSYGIRAQSSGGETTVTSMGNIDAGRDGIRGTAGGDLDITSTGNIAADEAGIDADANGDIDVKSEGNINAVDGGIDANADGNASVTSSGNIDAGRDGIRASAYNGDAVVESEGNVNAVGDGIIAGVGYPFGFGSSGDATVTSTGDITSANGRGIYTYSFNDAATVNATGNIESLGGGITANAGAAARVTHRGNITTRDDDADGIFAFSAYPGGSIAVNQTGNISTQGDASSGISANAFYGPITVNQTGIISTRGDGAFGIRVTSTTRATVTQTGHITTQGYGAYGIFVYSRYNAPITIRKSGDITTSGDFADGISAESNAGGEIVITQSGNITVTGRGADAIDVNNPDDIGTGLVTIMRGSTITGGPEGDGIDFDGGLRNRVINYGTITTLGENAIESDDTADDVVDNYGTVTGNVDLGGGTDRFNNRSGGLFNSGTNVFLGAGGLLHNAGTVSPGGAYTIRTTTLTGNMVQTSRGTFAVDLDLAAAQTDRLNATGTAKLNGTVAVKPKNPAALTQEFVILSADGGVTNNGLALGPVSPILQAELLFPNPNDVVLGIDVDFAIDGLNRNQTAIAKNLNSVLGAGGGTLGPVFNGFLNLFTLNGVRNALDQLSPEIYADTEIAALYSSFDFSDSLLSCKVNGADTASINTEGQCLWVGAKGRYLEGDSTFEYIGFDETAVQFAGGAQFALNSVWRLGFGAGYQASTLTTDTAATSDGDQVQGGVALKYNPGALLVAGTFSGGRGWYDTTRPMAFGGFAATATSDHEIDILQGRLHASYVMGSPGLYYKPIVDAAVTDIALDDVRERGAGGASLFVRSDSHTVFSISPAVEIGTEWWWSNGTLVRPFVRGGVTWYSEDDVTVRASFSGAPAGVPSFAITAASDDVQADVAAGIEMISSEDSNLRLFYDGHFGDRLAVHAAGFKASVKF